MIHLDLKQLTHNKVSTRLKQAMIMMGIILIGIIISVSKSSGESDGAASIINITKNCAH